MKNIVLTGIGGQGTVLAAKTLAQAAQARGWHVRTAETIGMAQRGGSVVSHVRMGDCGEQVAAPLVSEGCADMLIAFEPGEGVRMMPILKPGGVMVTASRVVQPVTASLSAEPYEAEEVLSALAKKAQAMKCVSPEGEPPACLAGKDVATGFDASDGNAASTTASPTDAGADCGFSSAQTRTIKALYVVDEQPILEQIGNAKALNIVLLTVAVQAGVLGISLDEFKEAVKACVKPRFVDLNMRAIELTSQLGQEL